MGMENQHPEFFNRREDWQQLDDCYKGERTIKEAGVRYLPPTDGMIIDGMSTDRSPGSLAYHAYKQRAVFPDLLKQAIQGMLGVMHREPPLIKLPKKLEPLLKNATAKGESLHALLMKMNELQLIHGRMGLLLEVPNGVGVDAALPYLVPYRATQIVNWDDGYVEQGKQKLEFVVLDETEPERQTDFSWQIIVKYRILIMSSEVDKILARDQSAPATGVYQTQIRRETDVRLDPNELITPQIGGTPLNEIPFVFVNTKDLSPCTDHPPLLGLSNTALTIYRGEADYRQALYLQGQETLVIINGEMSEDHRVGAGARLELPKDSDAKYIGAQGRGLMEMREALRSDKTHAADNAIKLLDNKDNEESAEALKVRVSAKTANLISIARTSAAALQHMLRLAATWVGANPDEVVVEPNLNFANSTLAGRDMLDMTNAKALGFPISAESLHRIAKRHDLTEKTYEEEQEAINNEPVIGSSLLNANE